jgi:hypothetical protein
MPWPICHSATAKFTAIWKRCFSLRVVVRCTQISLPSTMALWLFQLSCPPSGYEIDWNPFQTHNTIPIRTFLPPSCREQIRYQNRRVLQCSQPLPNKAGGTVHMYCWAKVVQTHHLCHIWCPIEKSDTPMYGYWKKVLSGISKSGYSQLVSTTVS